MLKRRLRTVLVLAFAMLFAAASLGHAVAMLRLGTAESVPDCHAAVAVAAGDPAPGAAHDDPPDNGPPSHPASMPPGCPLANLPPAASAPAVAVLNAAEHARFAPFVSPWPPSADLDGLERPPRHAS